MRIVLALASGAIFCLLVIAFLIGDAKAQQNTESFLVLIPATCFEKEAAAEYFKSKSAKVVGWGIYQQTLKSAVFMNADGDFWLTAIIGTGRTCVFSNGSDWTPEQTPSH